MKKILAIAVALIMVMALTVCAFAEEVLYTHEFTDGAADGWWEEPAVNGLENDQALIEALKTDGAVIRITMSDASGGGQWGFQSTVTWKSTLIKSVDDHDENTSLVVVTVDSTVIEVPAADFLAAADEIGCDLSGYKWINGCGAGDTLKIEVFIPAADEAPAETEAPADTAPADEPAAPADEPAAPSTGLALAVVPAVVAMAAAVISKKR